MVVMVVCVWGGGSGGIVVFDVVGATVGVVAKVPVFWLR